MKDRYTPDSVSDEAPPREGVSAGQEGLDAAMVKAVKFPEHNPAQERWTDAFAQSDAILKRKRRKT